MKNRLLLPCVIIIAFLCASALPVHFMSYETTTAAVCQTTLTTEKETTSGQTEENKKEYIGITDSNTLISCIVMVDPDSFTSPQKADADQLFTTAFWCLLHSAKEKNYDFSLKQMTVSRKQAEKMYSSLFPDADIPEPCDIDFGGVIFVYDKKDNSYRVPVTGITPHYTAKIIKHENKADKQIFEVQYIPDNKWTQDIEGKIIPPKAEKTMMITLKKNNNKSLSVFSVVKK